MGTEIRRVPPDWKHPTYRDQGRHNPHYWQGRRESDDKYAPLYDRVFEYEMDNWYRGWKEWDADEHGHPYWEESNIPDPLTHRHVIWTEEEASAYQIYEDVSEGTPISPVFETQDEMKAWLLEQGHSEEVADRFIAQGWAFSAVFIRNADGTSEVAAGIDSVAL